MKKRMAIVLAILMVAMLALPVTAHAASAPVVSGNALAGVNINILDTTTPAGLCRMAGVATTVTAPPQMAER